MSDFPKIKTYKNKLLARCVWARKISEEDDKKQYNAFEELRPNYFIYLYREYGSKKLKKWGLNLRHIERLRAGVHPLKPWGIHHKLPHILNGGNYYRNFVLINKLMESLVHYTLDEINPKWGEKKENEWGPNEWKPGDWRPFTYIDFKIPVFTGTPELTMAMLKDSFNSFLRNPYPEPPPERAIEYLFRKHEIEMSFFERMIELLKTRDGKWKTEQNEIRRYMWNPQSQIKYYIPRHVLIQACSEFEVGKKYVSATQAAMKNFLDNGKIPSHVQSKWMEITRKNGKRHKDESSFPSLDILGKTVPILSVPHDTAQRISAQTRSNSSMYVKKHHEKE